MSSYHKNKFYLLISLYFERAFKVMIHLAVWRLRLTFLHRTLPFHSLKKQKYTRFIMSSYRKLTRVKKYNLILPSQSQLPRSRPFTRQSCPNISFLLAYFFGLFHLLFYWPCANTIKNFAFLRRRQWWIGRAHNKLIVWNPRKKSRGCRSVK